MAYRLPKSHPFSDDPHSADAIEEDQSLYRSAQEAADLGVISRRAFLGASTGVAAWLLVLDSRAWAEKAGGRKGYAIQSIVDRDQLLDGVVELSDDSGNETLSAAWGEAEPIELWKAARRPRKRPRLGNTAVEFAEKGEDHTRTRIDHQGIRPGLKSPFNPKERYRPGQDAERQFLHYERENAEVLRRIMMRADLEALESETAPRSGIRFVVTTQPTRVWCNRVGEVAEGAVAILPAWRPLTYQGRMSNSVLIDHPVASKAANNGRLATFVDARNLVALDTQKRLYVRKTQLSEGHEPSLGCLSTADAREICGG